MKRIILIVFIILVGVCVYFANRYWRTTKAPCDLSNYCEPTRDALLPDTDLIDAPARHVVYLDQGWTPAESMNFYTRTQGSRLLPYSWFIALEQADNSKAFLDPANMNSFRYLTQKKNVCNPDGLPVGFVKDPPRSEKDVAWLGFNCAACHTNEVHYKGNAFRIDGGPTMANADLFLNKLTDALHATNSTADKFDRFATKVLAADKNTKSREDLKQQLDKITQFRSQYNIRNKPPHSDGFSRLDAFGRILNEVMIRHLKQPEDGKQNRPPSAPVSYPFLWDTPHHDFVQWNAVAGNRILGTQLLGSLSRNVGEVLGVFGEVEIPPFGEEQSILPGYDSSVRISDLIVLEEQIKKLQSPLWPNEFGPIDATLKAKGEVHFKEYCQHCHASINRSDPDRKVKAEKTPLRKIGTDPLMATNFSTRKGNTGPLRGRKKLFITGDRFEEQATGDEILVHIVLGIVIKIDNRYEKSENRFELFSLRSAAASADVYKGRPLNGIWATAPYLHNGSVPNMWELLKPAKDRIKTFSVGSREFDPVNIGFRSDVTIPKAFIFNTTDPNGNSIPGNSNAGHEYGTGLRVTEGGDGKKALTEQERWELMEYLKSL